jgi:hypothetical protein
MGNELQFLFVKQDLEKHSNALDGAPAIPPRRDLYGKKSQPAGGKR